MRDLRTSLHFIKPLSVEQPQNILYTCKPAKYYKLATCAADHKTDAGNLQKHAKRSPENAE